MNSPFGLVADARSRAIRCARRRSASPVDARLIAIYTIAAGYAGIAGALLAQTTAFVSLDVFSFERSADLLLVLIIGGTGYLYGGLIGAVIFKLMQDYLADAHAAILAVLDRPRAGGASCWSAASASRRLGDGHPPRCCIARSGAGSAPHRRAVERKVLTMTVGAAKPIGLEKRFGGIVASNDVSLQVEKGARHALIGPNGAGKTTVINLLTGVLRPSAGRIVLEGTDITDLEAHRRVRLGIARTFQINQLFADLTPIETIGLAVSERLGGGKEWWRLVGSKGEVDR